MGNYPSHQITHHLSPSLRLLGAGVSVLELLLQLAAHQVVVHWEDLPGDHGEGFDHLGWGSKCPPLSAVGEKGRLLAPFLFGRLSPLFYNGFSKGAVRFQPKKEDTPSMAMGQKPNRTYPH